jgi:hypothetical protein
MRNISYKFSIFGFMLLSTMILLSWRSNHILITSKLLSKMKDTTCQIKPFLGLNEIVIGESTLRDVEVFFGIGERKKEWRKGYELDFIGRYNRHLNYPQLGIDFSAFSLHRRFSKKIRVITLSSKCNCKTKEGVGIGSSYYDVIKLLGAKKLTTEMKINNKENKTVLTYFNGNNTMWFYSYGVKDTTNFIVDEIVMFKSAL